MNAAAMRTWFDTLQDKTNEPWFSDAEKDEFLEDAMWDIINDTVSKAKQDVRVLSRISTLVTQLTQSTTSAGLFALAGSDNVDILSLRLASDDKQLHFYSQDKIMRIESNSYKKGTASNPNFSPVAGGYQTYPVLNVVSLKAVYIKVPSTAQDLPDSMHRRQVALAMVKTGLVTEAEATSMIGATSSE